ncbi:HEAT repeat domain-containing protein [Chondromyces crocatus]|uniref:PBS lyase n=1 Tax=Chondromyces crocatus TaxID=52 RepID=A0A0K1E658_CHOCO|nr:HEAT repeat domain-containing protein [Chondromyces crocatus]AKT36162.1 uncharacterized protein CMC5_002760 [Chondromyces crocatus]
MARRNLEAAIRDLGSTRPTVRAEAIRDLVLHADEARERVLAALEGALRNDESGSVRAAAAVALADIQAVEALSNLLLAMEDDDPYVRQMAVSAVGELGDSRATARLLRALTDPRPEIRFQAVIAFPRISTDTAQAFEVLLEATRDEDPLVCHIALRMSEELGSASPSSASASAERSSLDRRDLAPLDLPDALMERTRTLLHHASGRVRTAAAVLLARCGEEVAIPVLVEAVEGKLAGADREDEAAAIELCGELEVTAARPALQRRAFGGVLGFGRDALYWHARVALARMGDPRAEQEILRELRARDRDRRTLAVAAAGRARLRSAEALLVSMRGDAGAADPDAVEEAIAALALDRRKG